MRWFSSVSFVVVTLLVGCDTPTGDAPFSVVMDDAGGMRPGAPVYVAGVQVGRVKSVGLDGTKARVDFALGTDPKITVRKDACASVGRYGLAGDAHLTLEPGADPAPVLDKGRIECVKSHGELEASAARSLASVEKILSAALEGKGTIGRLLQDEKLAERVVRYFEREPTADAATAPAAPPPSAVAPKVPRAAPRASAAPGSGSAIADPSQ